MSNMALPLIVKALFGRPQAARSARYHSRPQDEAKLLTFDEDTLNPWIRVTRLLAFETVNPWLTLIVMIRQSDARAL
jgi:hypothetical protein